MNSERSPWLDNAKGILIVLVIWGHLIEQAASNNAAIAGLYVSIYLFHMPAFVLISGMLSRAELDEHSIKQIGLKLLFPLVLFQALYWPWLAVFKPESIQDPLAPVWLLWFLLSLATWRVMLPLFLGMPFPVLASISLAVLAGFVDAIDGTFSLSRTFFFFLAFLIGHLYRPQIETLAAKTDPAGATIFMLLVGISGLQVANGTSVLHLYGSIPYSYFSIEPTTVALHRLQIILMDIASAVAVLSLVPRHSRRLTELGRQTMPVFLSHGFLITIFWATIPEQAAGTEGVFLVLTGVLAALIAFALAHIARVSLGFWVKRWSSD